jgi:tRNA (mo5U34)-methyltransferase
VTPALELDRAAPRLGAPVRDREALAATLMELHPWRKGPLELGGVPIDTEWRSDWKWSRIAPHLAGRLEGRTVLDVGCGNGYFGWRLLGAGARLVLGLDPTLLFVMQWLAQRHFARPGEGLPPPPNWVLPLRDTDLAAPDDGASGSSGAAGFETALSLGVLYHRRDPADHLARLRGALRRGGDLLLETLVLDRPGDHELNPTDHGDGRYARMRNVWSVPTPPRVECWLREAGFEDPRLLNLTRTTVDEQRSTAWMRFESLDRCLDPERPELTVEGHPAPVRALFIARRPDQSP